MTSKRADKKKLLENKSLNFTLKGLNGLIQSNFYDLFRMYTKDSTHTALQYIAGLLRCEKGHKNMERMTEKVEDADYKRYVHFLSASQWSADEVNAVTLSCADEKFCTLVGSKLFLPEEWCNDRARCQGAGIPEEHRVFKTKPQLALELVNKLSMRA